MDTKQNMSVESRQKLSIISGPTEPALLNWTFNDLLQQRLLQHPKHVAVRSKHQNSHLTYTELHQHAENLAARLYNLGIRNGDRVGVLLGNRLEYAIVSQYLCFPFRNMATVILTYPQILFACSKLGAYFTLYNYAYTPSELVNAIQATTPKVLFTTLKTCRYNYEAVLEDLGQSAACLRQIVLLDDITETKASSVLPQKFTHYKDLLNKASDAHILKVKKAQQLVRPENILNLQFTSGSTGLPKAAALTHYGMLNSARYIGLQMKIQPTDRINVPVPLFHAFGLVIGSYSQHELLIWLKTYTNCRSLYGFHVWQHYCTTFRIL